MLKVVKSLLDNC